MRAILALLLCGVILVPNRVEGNVTCGAPIYGDGAVVNHFDKKGRVSRFAGLVHVPVIHSRIQKEPGLALLKQLVPFVVHLALGRAHPEPWPNDSASFLDDGRRELLGLAPVPGHKKEGCCIDRYGRTSARVFPPHGYLQPIFDIRASIGGINYVGVSHPSSFRENHIAAGFGGPDRSLYSLSGKNEVLPDEDNTRDTQYRLSESNPKHPHSPTSHALLGTKVAGTAFVFLGGLLLVLFGFKRAGDATDAVLDGAKVAWFRFALWFAVMLCGAGLASGVITYWLAICERC